VIHRLELYHHVLLSFLSGQSGKRATTTIDGFLYEKGTPGYVWDSTVQRDIETSRRGGRKTIGGSLNLRTPAPESTGTLISTVYAQSRQVPQRFNRYSHATLLDDSRQTVFTPITGRPLSLHLCEVLPSRYQLAHVSHVVTLGSR